MKTLSIVVPVYNEKKTLLSLLEKIEAVNITDIAKEIILVDDNSNDGTKEVLEKLDKTKKYRILFQDKNSGKGAALRAGFEVAAGDYIVVQDADLEYDPNDYIELLRPLRDGRADVVYGSRFMGDKAHRALFFWHYIGNKILTIISNIFTGLNLSDMETCYKIFSREALKKVLPDLRSNRFGFEPEVTASISSHRLRIFEVGISYAGRTYEDGKKINWKDGVSAIWTILKSAFRFSSIGRDKWKTAILIVLLILPIFSISVLHPQIHGDSVSYYESIGVLRGGAKPANFIPNRIITTYFGLQGIRFVDLFFNNLNISWLVFNSILFLAMGIFFYSLIKRIFQESQTAFIGTLLLVTNYSAVTSGLSYLMDIGGWTFYIISLYFSYRYLQNKRSDFLWLSAIALSIGGLSKESSLFGLIVLFGAIIYENWGEWWKILKYLFFTGIIASGPFIIVEIYSHFAYHYTYLNWMSEQGAYVYKSRIIEYVKSFGSLYNFGWFIFLPGAYLLIREYRKIFSDRNIFFICLVALSAMPVLIWAAITQRILFISVPAIILVSSLFINKLNKKWYFLLPILLLYIVSSYLMDSVILNSINLPI